MAGNRPLVAFWYTSNVPQKHLSARKRTGTGKELVRMSINLIDLVKSQLGGQVLNQVSGLLGESPEKTQSAVNGAVPALLGGLLGNATKGNGAANMLSALNGLDDSMLGNFAGMLGGGNQSSGLMDMGGKLLGSLMGGSGVNGLTNAISGFSGLGKGAAGSLLGLLAPLLMGTIKRQLSGSGGLNIGNLTNLLTGQKDNIAAAMPAGLDKQLQSAGLGDLFGGALSNLAGAGQQAVGSATNAVNQASGAVTKGLSSASNAARNVADNIPTRRPASPLRWLAPLAIVLVAGWFLFNRNNAPATPAVEMGGTGSTEAAMVGDVDVGKEFGSVFTNLTSTLNGIKDEATATSALPKLEEIAGNVDNLSGLFGQLPDAAKTGVASLVKDNLGGLNDVISKITALPGVGDIVKTVLDNIVKTLSGLIA
jgi:hypothetical protein